MDPYLEARWSNVHPSLLFLIQEVLQPALPPGLRARIEERIVLEAQTGEPQTYRSDIAVVESVRKDRAPTASGSAVLAPQPIYVEFFEEPAVDRFLQIIDTHDGNLVVTAIELLSPANKGAGDFNRKYRNKLRDYKRAAVNVVELDLLRSSRGRLPVEQADLPPERRTPYLASILRAGESQWEVYPLSLREPLPVIPIPLRETDGDVMLALQPLIERVYVAGGHDDIDYSKPPEPPLQREDAAWADELLRSVKLH
jgi:hypothetical protein